MTKVIRVGSSICRNEIVTYQVPGMMTDLRRYRERLVSEFRTCRTDTRIEH